MCLSQAWVVIIVSLFKDLKQDPAKYTFKALVSNYFFLKAEGQRFPHLLENV